MKIESKFQKKKPVLSFEIFPPKRDKAIQNIDETLAILSELNPDFISVTFGAGGSHTDNQTVELAKRIKQQYGIDPLVHLTCLNSSKFEICELLEELKEAEIDSILALRGDKNPAVEEKQDFRYASDLVKFIRQYGDFSISGACYPECHTESKNKIEDIAYLKERWTVGAASDFPTLFRQQCLLFLSGTHPDRRYARSGRGGHHASHQQGADRKDGDALRRLLAGKVFQSDAQIRRQQRGTFRCRHGLRDQSDCRSAGA